jgi:gentisate 1,2-dioxygenase
MDYKLFKNALTTSECEQFIALGKSQYPLLKEDQLYPNRGYPGFTLQNATIVLDKLATFITQTDFNIKYDYSFGTGVNFINAEQGEQIGQHIDKPLYELDDNYKVKSEFENRVCAVTVLAGIGGSNIISVEDEDIQVSAGDVIVLKGFTAHEMKPIVSDTFYLLSAFYCSGN